MKQLILCISALIAINTATMETLEQQLKELNKMPIIQKYREYAFAQMKPTSRVFLAEFPNDPKSKTVERYLYQLSFAATIYKLTKRINQLPETEGEIPEEIRAVYSLVPSNAFVYHIIVNDETVLNEKDLPYGRYFDAKQEWKNDLEQIELDMITELENQSSE